MLAMCVTEAYYYLTLLIPSVTMAIALRRKRWFILRAGIFLLFACLVIVGISALIEAGFIWFSVWCFALYYVLNIAGVKCCFECNLWMAAYCATNGYCVQHIAARSFLLIMTIFNLDSSLVTGNFVSFFFLLVVCVVIYLCFLRKRDAGDFEVNNKVTLLIGGIIFLISIFSSAYGDYYIALFLQSGTLSAESRALQKIFYLVTIVVAVLAFFVNLMSVNNRYLMKENETLQYLMEKQKEQYENEKDTLETINIKCHDIKHWIASLRGGIYDETLDELSNAVNVYDAKIKTGNEALDIVLWQKMTFCEKQGIRLTCMIDGKHFSSMPAHECYALFCNVFDNAIGAVGKLPEEKRVSSMTETREGGTVCVRVENFYAGDIALKNGLPVSQKRGHGYGMKSICQIAGKYGGKVTAEVGKDTFVLNLQFPLAV